jgi:DNA-directed RNA polymerase subunit M/transcription elongation factor TFIIS|tara:strand:+ start:556 stop:912 length:357 start_codon:yes stop_codon:yes gene_type:complete
MEFCEVCDNMLYVKTNEDKQLVKYCKHCAFEKIESSNTAIKISQTIYSEDDLLYNQHVNKYLRFDPTLRRIIDPHIACPNTECSAPPDKNQVIYIKYDSKNMKYLYVCETCGETWKQN